MTTSSGNMLIPCQTVALVTPDVGRNGDAKIHFAVGRGRLTWKIFFRYLVRMNWNTQTM